MKVEGIDERALGFQRYGCSFVAFIYEGAEDDQHSSWSVDGLLLTDTDLPQVLAWMRGHLPVGCCWSLGVESSPPHPTPNSQVDVAWIVGDDVLNTPRESRTDEERRVAAEMLERRDRVTLI